MSYNVGKGQVVTFWISSLPNYYLGNECVTVASTFRYLEVEISNTFDWSFHIDAIVCKAFSILGMPKTNPFHIPTEVKLIAYKSLCRPILEYVCEVWDPYFTRHTEQIERAQNKTTRLIVSLRGMCGISDDTH